MRTLEFLKTILPSQGTYVLALITGKYTHHHPFATLEELADAVARFDANQNGKQVYHACASFADGTLPPNGGLRKAENVAFVRSVWADVDIGPNKPYKTGKEAFAALTASCRTLDIPAPLIIQSGRGMHLYWCYDEDIPATVAKPVAEAFKRALQSTGLAIDGTRTADLASVLRPVGSTWRKAEPRPVRMLGKTIPKPLPIERIQAAAKPYQTITTTRTPLEDEWGASPKDYPPSYAQEITRHCPAIAQVVDAGGAVEEPLWRAMIGVVKFTVEGTAQIHAWSQGDTRYDESETQRKIDGWKEGPATCSYIESLGGACDGCQYRGKTTSPIQLGYRAPAEPATQSATIDVEDKLAALQAFANKKPADLPFWMERYRWDDHNLSLPVQDENDATKWVPFCNKLIYPFMRVRLEDGTSCLRVCTLGHDRNQERWRTFDIPTTLLPDKRQLSSTLAAYEVFLIGKNGADYMRAFLQDMLRQLETMGLETRTLNHFGWVDDGFVMGSSLITPKDEFPVILGDAVPEQIKHSFTVKGTAKGWATAVDKVYNRSGAEPYQFLILSALASPLVELASSEMWHGIPVALTGASGLGKTTACHVACSAYGPPGAFWISANRAGATLNALLQRVAVSHNIPLVMDELHKMKADQIPDLLYALSNGQPKNTLRADRSFRNDGLAWNLFPLITGNLNITNLLSQFEQETAEATQLRCFEIALPPDINQRIFSDVNAKDIIENDILHENYGAAGRLFLRAVMANKDKVRKALHKARIDFVPDSQEMTRERFYYDTIATVLVAGKIAHKLGLINFDLKALRKWAIQNVETLRTMRRDATTSFDDRLQTLLTELTNRIVVTATYPRRRGERVDFVDTRSLKDPIAREVRNDGTLIITQSGLRDWCRRKGTNFRDLLDELERHEYMVPPKKYGVGKHGKMYPFRGTDVVANAGQASVIILDLEKMRGEGAPYPLESVPITHQSPEQSPAAKGAHGG